MRDHPSFHLLICHVKERQTPSSGLTLELGFLGFVFHVELPTSSDSQQLAETASFAQKFDPAEHVSRLPCS